MIGVPAEDLAAFVETLQRVEETAQEQGWLMSCVVETKFETTKVTATYDSGGWELAFSKNPQPRKKAT